MSMRTTIALATFACIALPGAASADVIAPDGRVIECFCTGTQGERWELGDVICLTVNGRSYLAKCVMAQNVPFWRDQNQGCLSSHMTPRPDMNPTFQTPRQVADLR
jgi:hypothetical protein